MPQTKVPSLRRQGQSKAWQGEGGCREAWDFCCVTRLLKLSQSVLYWIPGTARGLGTGDWGHAEALSSYSPSRKLEQGVLSQPFREHFMAQMKPSYMTWKPFKTKEENICLSAFLFPEPRKKTELWISWTPGLSRKMKSLIPCPPHLRRAELGTSNPTAGLVLQDVWLSEPRCLSEGMS